jgi:hypothetical protein
MTLTNEQLLKKNADLDAQLVELTGILEKMICKMDSIESELVEMRRLMAADFNKDKS